MLVKKLCANSNDNKDCLKKTHFIVYTMCQSTRLTAIAFLQLEIANISCVFVIMKLAFPKISILYGNMRDDNGKKSVVFETKTPVIATKTLDFAIKACDCARMLRRKSRTAVLRYNYSLLNNPKRVNNVRFGTTTLSANCKVFYSEGTQHNSMTDNRLQIINPFL